MTPHPPIPHGLYILGCGGHARSVADVALAAGVYHLVFVDPDPAARSGITGFDTIAEVPTELEAGFMILPAVGSAEVRRRLCEHAARHRLATLVAPTATLGHGAVVGPGTFVGHHAHIGPYTQIGDGVIVNTGAIVEHDCVVGSYSHVSVNATIAGRCTIGEMAMIGAGAVLIDGVTIADDVTIGAGATVVCSLHASGTYVGTPARKRP